MGKARNKISLFRGIFKITAFISLFGLLLAYLCPFVHPSTFWPLPFFGLAYPVIMGIVLILLVIGIFLKSRMVILILVVILIGGKLHLRSISLPFDKQELEEDQEIIKVLDYNVRLFDLYNYADNKYANRNAIFKYLEEQNADVICFQEFYQQDKPTVFPTKDTLLTLLGTKYSHERYSHKLTGRQNFGIAMFSKYPMIARGDVMFDDPENKDNNYCIYADIVKGQDTFRIYNAHFQSIKFQKDDYAIFGENQQQVGVNQSSVRLMLDKLRIAFPKRADQARKVMEHIEQSPYDVIICGDFNDTPISYTYNIFYSRFVDAFRNSASGIGSTYAGKVPAGRIDYIFHSKNLKSANFTIQEDVHSDHRAIQCEIWKPKVSVHE
ncbi:MAG: endonuclease/exonuclease/phosphatase family protein [Crocinitomicaceae bacterium]|nr:endonuclease/exonuclease/phosphatase family protein [Crocinitomicaceae bacterium]